VVFLVGCGRSMCDVLVKVLCGGSCGAFLMDAHVAWYYRGHTMLAPLALA